MRFLILSLSLGLLACSKGPPSPQAHLPALDSADADAAHAAYHGWVQGLPEVLEGTQVSYDLRIAVDIRDARQVANEGRFELEGTLSAAHGNEEKLRLDVDLDFDLGGSAAEELPAGLVSSYRGGMILDGELLWLHGESDQDGPIPTPGYAFRMDQQTALEVYGNVRQIEGEEAAQLERALPGSLPFFHAWEASVPSRLERALQPKGTLTWFLPFLTCRSFERQGGEVIAELSLDLRKDSEFATMMLQVIRGLEQESYGQAREYEDVLGQIEHNLDLVGRWDATTGVLRSLKLRLVIRGEELRTPMDGDFHLHIDITGVDRVLPDEELEGLLAQTYPRASNIDGLIKLAIAAGEFEVAEEDSSGEDYDF